MFGFVILRWLWPMLEAAFGPVEKDWPAECEYCKNVPDPVILKFDAQVGGPIYHDAVLTSQYDGVVYCPLHIYQPAEGN